MKDKKLTFCVSGKLWNRSLVMMDIETRTLWSHILGQAMSGELKGEVLESIPSEMTTWRHWKEEHPNSTVLNLPPTRFTQYTKKFYSGRPSNFVYGAVVNGEAFHLTMPELTKMPIRNATAGKKPVLLVTDPDSTSVRMFDRVVDGKTLTFEKHADGLKDRGTGSVWSVDGVAIEGPFKGKRLHPLAGLMSYTRAWRTFHPKSRDFTTE